MSESGRKSHPRLPVPLRIAVCDDEPGDRRRLSDDIRGHAGARSLEIEEFADGQSLLAADATFDLIFLDILMAPGDGMEAARRLRQRQCRALIVFVSRSRDHLTAGYEVEAFRYLLKPYTPGDVAAVLSKAFARLDMRGIVFRSAGTVHRISFEEISYIEAQGRRCRIVLTDGSQLSVGEGISQLEKRLNPEILMRCQKSFIVNIEQIASLRRYEAVLKSGITVPVSRQLWPEVQDQLISFLSLD